MDSLKKITFASILRVFFQIVCVRVANNELDILKRAFMYDVGSDVVSAIADCNYGETQDYRSFSAMAAQASASANA